jgi:chromosome segregation ATPase
MHGRCLQDSLGGNSKTVMLATVSPAPESYSETVSTLRYVERAKRIVNLAHVNDGETNPLLLKLKDEVAELRAELHRVQQEHKHKEEVWQKNDSTVASQLLRIQKQVEQQRSRADAAESSAKALAETLAAREREVSLLHQEEASITAKVRKLEGAVTASDAAASQLQNELSQALHRLSESHNTISESKMKREELSEMISSLQAEIKTLRESSAALEEDVTRLQRGKLSSEATSGDLREKMTTLQDQFSSSLRDSATSIERLEAELASAETARIELESSTALRLKEMQVAANGEKDNLTQTIASLQAKASLAEESALSLESHVQQLQNELITSQNMVSRLSEQALEREKVEMAQRDELSNSQAACLELIAKEKRHADELAVALSGLKEAQNRISSSDVTIARLNRDCESLHGAQSDLQQKLSDFEIRESTMLNDLEHRSVQVSSLETQISSLEVSKSSLEEQVAELLRQVEEGCARLSSSEAQASERGNANQQLQQQLRTLEAEKMRVEGELSSSTGRLSDMVKERDELIQTTSLLRQELSSIKMLHSNVEYELSALAAAKRDSESDAAVIHQKMTAQLADLQAAKSASESNFSDLSKLNASLRAEYESSVSLLEKERMRTQEVQMKGQSEAQNLQQRITGLLRDVKDAHENLEERQSELASSRLLAENLQSELTELAAFNAGMQSDSAALHNKLSESASRFELEKADIRKEAENLRDELMCIRSSHSTLEQEIAAAASTAAECALKHNLELSRLNLENDKVSKEMKELQQELSSTRASHATDIAAAASIAVAVEAKHDSQLSEIRNELAKASSDLALSQIRASKAEEDKAGFLAKVKSLEERLSALVDEKQAADSTVQKMRSELASLQMAHSNAEFELSALAAAKLDAESDAVAAREEMMVQMSQLQVNNNELVSQITEVRDSNAKLKRDVEDAEKRCTSLEHDMSGLLLEKEAGDDLIFDLRSKFNALEGDQETSKQELEALRMDFASSSRSLEEELHSRAALEEERCTLINAKCALESRVERLELELTDQQRQHEGLLSTLSQSKKEVIELQANEQQSCRELQLLHGEYQTLEAKLAELKLEYCEALTLNSSLQKNAAESAKILQDANEQLEVDKASLQAANTEMAAAKAALKQELNFCERRVELLERELTEAQEGVCAAAQVIDSLKIEGDAALNQVNEMIQQARAQALVHGEKLSAAVLDKEESLRSEHQELLRSKVG